MKISQLLLVYLLLTMCPRGLAVPGKTYEPNGTARHIVKRDLRIFALPYKDLMEVIEARKAVIDLAMTTPLTQGRPVDMGFHRAHMVDAGETLNHFMTVIKEKYGSVISPNNEVVVFKWNEISLGTLSEMSEKQKDYVLQPGDVVIFRNVSDI